MCVNVWSGDESEATRIVSGVQPRGKWIFRQVGYGWKRTLRRLWRRGLVTLARIFCVPPASGSHHAVDQSPRTGGEDHDQGGQKRGEEA